MLRVCTFQAFENVHAILSYRLEQFGLTLLFAPILFVTSVGTGYVDVFCPLTTGLRDGTHVYDNRHQTVRQQIADCNSKPRIDRLTNTMHSPSLLLNIKSLSLYVAHAHQERPANHP